MRVIHAPAAVAGNPQQLALCMATRGHHVTTLVYEANQYVVDGDILLWSDRAGPVQRELRRIFAVTTHVWKHDVYVFNYGATLAFPPTDHRGNGRLHALLALIHTTWVDALQVMELIILWARRASVVVVFQGDDARQGDVLQARYSDSVAHHVPPGYYTPKGDRRKRRIIRRLRRFSAKLITLNPDLLELLGSDAEFVPYGHLDITNWRPTPLPTLATGLVLGHFPSNPHAKGTYRIVDAVERIHQSGLNVRLELLTGVSQQDVRAKMSQCHVIIDQLYAGFYGGVAVEAMALGRPVASFVRRSDLSALSTSFVNELPIFPVSPSTLESDIRLLATRNAQDLEEMARLSREFVDKWHNPHDVAQQLLSLARPLQIRWWTQRDSSGVT